MRVLRRGALAAGLVLVGACSPFGGGAFACDEDADCAGGGPEPRCEPDSRCSFLDSSCTSGRRYGELSGDRADVCVEPSTGIDAGPDAPPDTPPPPFCDAANEPALVGCWEFEGNTNDASGDANGATAQNTTFVAGRVGMGLGMDGTSLVSVADSASMSPTMITIEAWLYPTQLPTGGARQGILDNDGSYGFFVTATGLSCTVNAAVATTTPLVANTWTHVACSYDGTTGRLYVNGLERGSATSTGALGAGNNNGSQIGGNSPSNDRFIGTIDQMRVWNVPRTATEICVAADGVLCP